METTDGQMEYLALTGEFPVEANNNDGSQCGGLQGELSRVENKCVVKERIL